MNWDDIQYFLAVLRGGSFLAAGKTLGVSHATVARRISGLEEDLGTLLFQRSKDGVMPLAAAHAILETVEAMERHAGLVPVLASTQASSPEGSVRVATTQEVANDFITPRISEFHRRYPKITIEFLLGSGYVEMSRGDVDIAIRFARSGDPAPVAANEEELVIVRNLGVFHVCLYASPAYLRQYGVPNPDTGFKEHSVVLPPDGVVYIPGAIWMLEHARRAHVSMRIDSLTGIMHACLAGVGLAALPSILASRRPGLERLDWPGVVASHEAWMLIPAAVRHMERVRLVADYLSNEITQVAQIAQG